MEQPANDNFDKLFRKVANKYPLNTNNKNWDIVAAKLKQQKLIAKTKSNKKWQFVALLLLTTIGSFGVYFYGINSIKTKQLSKNIAAKSSKKFVQQLPQNSQKFINQNKGVENITVNNNQPLRIINKQNYNNNISSVSEKTNAGNFSFTYSTSYQHQNLESNFLTFNNTDNFRLAELPALKNNYYPGFISKNLYQKQSLYLLVNDKTNESSNLNQQKKSTHIKLKTRPANFLYGSFFMSPDFSTVKYQQLNAPGFKIGVQLGYRISNSFSAEISLARYHSDFYSAGKYFDITHAKVNNNTTINRVHGQSKMTDVPVGIRYNFSKSNDHFFVTAGTNIMLLTHTERYKYDVTKRNGTKANISKRFAAVSGTKYFSNINISAGYEAPLINSFKIKAEPYYQIPTKNFGIGNLPVTHFGINIGIVKDLK